MTNAMKLNTKYRLAAAVGMAALALSLSATTVDGVLSENDTVLTVTVESGEADLGTGNLSKLTGNMVLRLVKDGAGTLVVPTTVDLSAYTGALTVSNGVYRVLAASGAGSTAAGAGAITVVDGGAFEIAPASTVMNLGAKKIFFEGDGPDGNGALRSAAGVNQDGTHVFGTNLVMTGNAVISSLTQRQLSLGNNATTPWFLDMGGHDLELRPYTGPNGLSAQNIRLMGRTTVSDPGNIKVLQGVLIFRENPNTATLGGSSASKLQIASSAANGAGRLEFSKMKIFAPWTLEWNTDKLLTVVSTELDTTTNQNMWAGPVSLCQDMSVRFGDYQSFQRLSFHGKVSGDCGFIVGTANDSVDGELILLSGENDFSGGVRMTNANLRLMVPGALPKDGGDFAANGSTLFLEGVEPYELPGASFEGDSSVSGGNGRWTGDVLKLGSGTLDLATAVGGPKLDVRSGHVKFSMGPDARLAGLVSGCRFYGTYDDAVAAYESGEVVTNCVELKPYAAYDFNHAYWNTANALITYTGYLWSDAETDATWSFVTALGRKAKLVINGVTVIEHEYVTSDSTTSKKTCGHANATIHPGANRFELRICTKNRSEGPSCLSEKENPQWVKSKFGFVVDRQGRDSVDYRKYEEVADNGNSRNVSWFAYGAASTATHPETGDVLDLVASFDQCVFAVGTDLDCAGLASYSVGSLVGFPSVLNCGAFGVNSLWTVRTSDLGRGALAADGVLDLSAATLAVENDNGARVGAGTSFTIATAAGGVSGLPTLGQGANDWSVSLSPDGQGVVLTRKAKSMVLILR